MLEIFMFSLKTGCPVVYKGPKPERIISTTLCNLCNQMYMHAIVSYSKIRRGRWTMECIFMEMETLGYNSLKQEWWSLINDSRYPHSSTGIRRANKISMISSRQRKFPQYTFPFGIIWPITKGRNRPSVHICIAMYMHEYVHVDVSMFKRQSDWDTNMLTQLYVLPCWWRFESVVANDTPASGEGLSPSMKRRLRCLNCTSIKSSVNIFWSTTKTYKEKSLSIYIYVLLQEQRTANLQHSFKFQWQGTFKNVMHYVWYECTRCDFKKPQGI